MSGGSTATQTLERAGENLTRESLVSTIERGGFEGPMLTPFRSSYDFAGTAALVTDLVAAVVENADDCEQLLPRNLGFNVNYPSQPFRGVREATFADIDPLPTTYTQVDGDTWSVGYDLSIMQDATGTTGKVRTDYELLARGYAAITPLDGNLSASGAAGRDATLAREIVADLD